MYGDTFCIIFQKAQSHISMVFDLVSNYYQLLDMGMHVTCAHGKNPINTSSSTFFLAHRFLVVCQVFCYV